MLRFLCLKAKRSGRNELVRDRISYHPARRLKYLTRAMLCGLASEEYIRAGARDKLLKRVTRSFADLDTTAGRDLKPFNTY